MRLPHRKSDSPEAAAIHLSFEAAITAATGLAQILGDGDACDRLLLLKRDVVQRRLRREQIGDGVQASFRPRSRDLFTSPTTVN